jgi:hypothetical protein
MKKLIMISLTILSLLPPLATAENLVVNGDFETNDFTGWTQVGNKSDAFIDDDIVFPNGRAWFGSVGSLGGITQELSLTYGKTYLVSFYLSNDYDATPGETFISFSGQTLQSVINPPTFKRTFYSYNVVATADDSLTFKFRNDPDYFRLDTVSVILLGPSASDTQTSLQNTASSLQEIFTLEDSSITDLLTYENDGLFANFNKPKTTIDSCDKFCLAIGSRFNRAYKSALHSSNGLVTGSYCLNEHMHVGVWLDKNFTMHTKNDISVNKTNPTVGFFSLWNQYRSHQGLQAKFAVGYGQKDLRITRGVVGSSEPGEGVTKLATQGVAVDLINNIVLDECWIVSPFAGLYYTRIKANAYKEIISPSVTEPLTYPDLIQKRVTILAGLKFLANFDSQGSLYTSLGLELDLNNTGHHYSVTGISELNSIDFNIKRRILRPIITLGGFYKLADGHRISIKGSYRKESFKTLDTISIMTTYAVYF